LNRMGMIDVANESRRPIEPAVVEAAVRLEPAALDRLVEVYAPRLYGFFLRATGSRDDAEDLVQDAFVRMVRSLPDYRHGGRLDAWVFRIAANLLRDRARRRLISPVAPLREPLDLNVVNGACDRLAVSASKAIERDDEAKRLGRALERLPEAERVVVLLRHYGELGFNEIAELMDTPLGTALARAHRGLAKLREWMESE
jgi:RNA polymerase sigma-70 factor (ECF subfamily)